MQPHQITNMRVYKRLKYLISDRINNPDLNLKPLGVNELVQLRHLLGQTPDNKEAISVEFDEDRGIFVFTHNPRNSMVVCRGGRFEQLTVATVAILKEMIKEEEGPDPGDSLISANQPV